MMWTGRGAHSCVAGHWQYREADVQWNVFSNLSILSSRTRDVVIPAGAGGALVYWSYISMLAAFDTLIAFGRNFGGP